MLEEKISRHLNIPFVEIMYNNKKYYLCNNGVLFADSEYMEYTDLNAEYERRAKEDKLYDYQYAKSTGLLRKKRGLAKVEHTSDETEKATESQKEQEPETNIRDRREDEPPVSEVRLHEHKRLQSNRKNIFLIILILAFASVCSMYESTLHTATYLYDYVDLISAWLLSTAVTAYNSSAFEVSVMFHNMKRNFMAFIFMLLWAMVTVFSMATTVSVFYDRFNFNETQIAQENKAVDSNKLGLELLRTKEKDLREAIEFKKKDIEYRQEREYATTAVRLELETLQKELQENLTEQQKLLEETPEVMEEKLQRKESLFAFLGRLIGLEGGILEFIMSTLSAIFINLIAPLSLTAVIELNKRKEK